MARVGRQMIPSILADTIYVETQPPANRLEVLDWYVLAAYGLLMLGIGWYFSRRTRTVDDYLLGGRQMRSWTVGLSLFATLLSTISYLATPGEIIRYGPMIMSGVAAIPLIILIVGWVLIPAIMKVQVTTAYEILELHLGVSVRVLGSTFFLAQRLIWMALIIYATTSKVLVPLLQWPPSTVPYVCLALGLFTVVYTSLGGLRAVVWTDAIQTFILFSGAILSIVVITSRLGGTQAWLPDQWPAHWQEPAWLFEPERITVLGATLALFVFWICTSGSDQMAIQRYLATRDAKSARHAFLISIGTDLLVTWLLAALGLALLAYFKTYSEFAPERYLVENADELFPQFIVVGLPPGVSGLVVAALLAAAMSSLSSGLNSSCSVITIDLIQRFRRTTMSDSGQVLLARTVSVVLGLMVVGLGLLVGAVSGNLLEVAHKTAGLLIGPLFGLFFLALFVPGATSRAALVSAVIGVITVVLVVYWEPITGQKGISFIWATPVALVTQIMCGVLWSWTEGLFSVKR